MSVSDKSGQICLSINGTTKEDVLRVAKGYGSFADLIEIRLDLLDTPVVLPFLDVLDLPLLFTNRAEWEGGGWDGSETERLELLLAAIRSGAKYVDIELQAPQESVSQIVGATRSCECGAIVSWHNFTETPDDAALYAVLDKMMESGADIGKIVTTAHDYSDTLRVLALQLIAKKEGFALACFSMGKAGQISRAATLSLGGVLTYGAADAASCTAPGQLTVEELRTVAEMLR